MRFILFFFFATFFTCIRAQPLVADSLRKHLPDSAYSGKFIEATIAIASAWQDHNQDSAIFYIEKGIDRSRKSDDSWREVDCLQKAGSLFTQYGLYLKALDYLYSALKLSEASGDEQEIGYCYAQIASVFSSIKDWNRSIDYNKRAATIGHNINDSLLMLIARGDLANTYENLNRPDTAMVILNSAIKIGERLGIPVIKNYLDCIQANCFARTDDYQKAIYHYRISTADTNLYDLCSEGWLKMAVLMRKKGQTDSAYDYAQRAAAIAKLHIYPLWEMEAYRFLATDSGIYKQEADKLEHWLFHKETLQKINTLAVAERIREEKLEKDKMAKASLFNIIQLAGLSLLFLPIIIFLPAFYFRKSATPSTKKAINFIFKCRIVLLVLFLAGFVTMISLYINFFIDGPGVDISKAIGGAIVTSIGSVVASIIGGVIIVSYMRVIGKKPDISGNRIGIAFQIFLACAGVIVILVSLFRGESLDTSLFTGGAFIAVALYNYLKIYTAILSGKKKREKGIDLKKLSADNFAGVEFWYPTAWEKKIFRFKGRDYKAITGVKTEIIFFLFSKSLFDNHGLLVFYLSDLITNEYDLFIDGEIKFKGPVKEKGIPDAYREDFMGDDHVVGNEQYSRYYFTFDTGKDYCCIVCQVQTRDWNLIKPALRRIVRPFEKKWPNLVSPMTYISNEKKPPKNFLGKRIRGWRKKK